MVDKENKTSKIFIIANIILTIFTLSFGLVFGYEVIGGWFGAIIGFIFACILLIDFIFACILLTVAFIRIWGQKDET